MSFLPLSLIILEDRVLTLRYDLRTINKSEFTLRVLFDTSELEAASLTNQEEMIVGAGFIFCIQPIPGIDEGGFYQAIYGDPQREPWIEVNREDTDTVIAIRRKYRQING